MNSDLKLRVIKVCEYIVETGATVRQAAKQFSISKSTIHKDCSERIYEIDPELAKKVAGVLKINFSERHIRGGIATQKKFSKTR